MGKGPFKMTGYTYPGTSPARKTPTENLADVDVSKLSEEEKKRYYAKVKEVTGADVVKHKGEQY